MDKKFYILGTLKFIFGILLLYGLILLILYKGGPTDYTTLLIDIINVAASGSLFIGSGVMLCLLEIIESKWEKEFEKKSTE